MRKNNCELIRRELDELMLGEACSASATQHLRECASCREFHEQQTKLRQIVGSLGTIEAPADFDFRLRARLASEPRGASIYWPMLRRGFAVATLLIVFATGAVLVRNVMDRSATVDDVAKKEQLKVESPSKPAQTVEPVAVEANVVATGSVKRPQTSKTERASQAAYKTRRSLATIDFSSERAEVLNAAEPVGVSAAFSLDASLQSFKVSFDDGRGNARTISVPTISFGSQRIVRSGNQFAPKRVW